LVFRKKEEIERDLRKGNFEHRGKSHGGKKAGKPAKKRNQKNKREMRRGKMKVKKKGFRGGRSDSKKFIS